MQLLHFALDARHLSQFAAYHRDQLRGDGIPRAMPVQVERWQYETKDSPSSEVFAVLLFGEVYDDFVLALAEQPLPPEVAEADVHRAADQNPFSRHRFGPLVALLD